MRPFRKKDIQAEIGRFMEVYNSAWEKNWGFVPLTENEVRHYAKQLKPFLDENWAYVAEKDGETVGAALTLPDYNQALHAHATAGSCRSAGRSSSGTGARSTACACSRSASSPSGSTPASPRSSTSATSRPRPRTPQTYGEMGWILETNKNMNKAMEAMGGEVVAASGSTSGAGRVTPF